MTTHPLLKDEEITRTYPTWTFDSSVLIPDQEVKGLFTFPEEVEELFQEEGFDIFAQSMEVLEASKVDGKNAFVSIGILPVAIIAESEEAYEDALDENLWDYASENYQLVVPGGKVIFVDDGLFHFSNDNEYLIRPGLEEN